MANSIEQWLKYLDAILEHHQFESEAEAEAWLREQSQHRTIDEFFETCATPALRLSMECQRAEEMPDPQRALAEFEKALDHAREPLAAEIDAATKDPTSWPESKVHAYLKCLFGRAACLEMLGELAEAEAGYQKVWEMDPLDSLGVVEKLFSLSLTDGRLADARNWLDRLQDDDSTTVLYHRALLRFEEAADEAERVYQQTGDLEAAQSWQDQQANLLLEKSLQRNPYVARLMAHPRAFELSCPQEAEQGSPDEAVQVMFASAHLWLSDFLALSWLISRAKHHAGDASVYDAEWEQLIRELGGEPSDEERFEYLRQLEELDG